MKQFIIVFSSLFFGLLAGMCVTRCQPTTPDAPVVVQVDTLIIRDTIREAAPSPRIIRVIDTAYLATVDTVRMNDTTYIPVPISQAEYEDSSYHAWVSGYRPALDSIHVFQKTQIIRETVLQPVRKSGWGFSVGAGPAVIWTPFNSLHVDGGIGIFAGVTYTF